MTVSEFNLRLFFAIDLPDNVKDAVAEIIPQLKKTFINPNNRWVKPENFHVTLQFLAAVDPLDILKLIDKTRTAIAGFMPFEMRLGPLEFFPPSAETPKIITLATEPQEELSQLAAYVGSGMNDAGYPPDERLFRGHLTLCRLNTDERKQPKALPNIKFSISTFTARSVALFRSEKIDNSFEYTILERFHASHVTPS
jgi:2'-5' RNA ligase